MGNIPDAAAVVAAVAALHDLVRAAFTGPPPDDAAGWAHLAGQAEQIATRGQWCRDATVAIARRAGASWSQLEHATGVADSTLVDRLVAFHRAEGTTT